MGLSANVTRVLQRASPISVIGLGYVGLPVACVLARAGYAVTGVDLKAERVAEINAGRCPIEGQEPGLSELLAQVVSEGRLRATTRYADLAAAEVVLICVETPIDEQHRPDYTALEAACRHLGPELREGALVVVESTIAPGTMDRLVLPWLEGTSGRHVNEGFWLAACPERVMPGKLLRNLAQMSRVIGASCPEAGELARALYSQFVLGELDVTDCVTAEVVKTAENAYRDVQIAFANEVALICEQVGADVWQVRDLVNKSPYRQMHLPGAGVGGHCIPKDPWLLAHGARTSPRLIPTARAVNDSMPLHVGQLVLDALAEAGRAPGESRVVMLGYAYLENADDTRNTPSEPLRRFLSEQGVDVRLHDPYVAEYNVPLETLLPGADALVLMVRHDEYRALDLETVGKALRTRIIVDGRNAWRPPEGFIYRAVGKAPHRGEAQGK